MTSIEGLCFLRIILMSLHDVNLQALLSVTSQCCRRTVVGSPRIDPPRPDAPGSDLGNRGRDVTANPRRRARAPPQRPRARRKEVTVRGQERTRFGGHEGSGSPGGRRLPSGALAEPHRSNAQTFGTLPGAATLPTSIQSRAGHFRAAAAGAGARASPISLLFLAAKDARNAKSTRIVSEPERRHVVPRARTGRRPRLHHSSTERALGRPAFPC